MTTDFFAAKRPHKGMTFEQFNLKTIEYIETTDVNILEGQKQKLYEYTKLNQHRSNRILKTYKVSDELCELMKTIDDTQIWMVITENWCGDSAQNLPYIAKIAECNPLVKLRIIERDKNLDIMDRYLTNGISRSIPKLVAFSEDGDEIFQWGPRPKELQSYVQEWKAQEIDSNEMKEKIHLWYGRNRGKNLEMEFLTIMKDILSFQY
ncbi:MAG: thioredoxin family protein [Melioribacteraceae bacterium]|nr:thioredoxin family protein [Melioribacteraceae bacterium]MCF8352974.1 thioredoxin family protein [Melioribacteraceae bacterium]MCF8395357.1 thioredoxin family protein [Melioribacteraceae bacterium]MCF8417841.1 thioredoxin family protein [Melioribacteraceae bacterium]